MSEMPEWIRQNSAERTKAAAARIKTEGIQFWSSLLVELEKNTRFLPEIGARGRTSNLSTPAEAQQRCRVDVARSGKVLGLTYIDLFYTVGQPTIECRTLEDGPSAFDICILANGELGAIPNDEFESLTATQMAERLVKGAVEQFSESTC